MRVYSFIHSPQRASWMLFDFGRRKQVSIPVINTEPCVARSRELVPVIVCGKPPFLTTSLVVTMCARTLYILCTPGHRHRKQTHSAAAQLCPNMLARTPVSKKKRVPEARTNALQAESESDESQTCRKSQVTRLLRVCIVRQCTYSK